MVVSDLDHKWYWDSLDDKVHDSMVGIRRSQVVIELKYLWRETLLLDYSSVNKDQLIELSDFLFFLKPRQVIVGFKELIAALIRVTHIIVDMSKLIAVWLVIVFKVQLLLELLVFSIQGEDIVDNIFDKEMPVEVNGSN